MIRSKSTITLIMSFLLLFAGGSYAFGQQETRASLGGRVTDPKGAVVSKATVVVTSDATGVTQTAVTNQTGDWIVKFLVPGFYHFEVSAPGFKRELRSSIELQVADQKFIETKLQVGEDTQSVTVEATTPLIDTTSAVSGTVVTLAEMAELPSQSDAPTMLVGLTPGAIVSAGVGGGVFLWSNGGLSGTVINEAGSGSGAINYAIDGGNVSVNNGNIGFEPPMDSVNEFRVVTNAYDATIGRQSSATINLSMKSGADKFHGDVYEDLQNDFFDAQYFNKIPNHPHIRVDFYGGSGGGPIWIPKLYDGRKKKTFFYYSFAGIRNTQPANTGTMSVPTALEKQGDFSQSYTAVTVNGVSTKYYDQIYDPATWTQTSGSTTGLRTQFGTGGGTAGPCTGCAIPSGRVDKIATALLNLIPNPENAGDGANSDSNNYVKAEIQQDKFAGNTLRFDQTWNEKNHSYVDLRNNIYTELSYDPFGPTNLLQGLYQKRVNRGMTLDHSITLSEQLLADLRYTVTRWEGSSYDPSAGVSPTTVGFPSSYAAQQQDPSLPAFTGIVTGAENGGLGTTQADSYTNDTNQDFNVSITQTLRNHSFRYGWEYMVQQEGTGGLGASGGTFGFAASGSALNWTAQNPDGTSSTAVGNNVADMVLGLPDSGSIPTNATEMLSQHYTALYFQDDWKLNSKLTVDLGLRWDYERPLTERYNRFFSRYNPSAVIAPVTALGQANYGLALATGNTGAALLQQYQPYAASLVVAGGDEFAGYQGNSRYATNPRYKYFQPRLGFAYEFRPNTVIRGGLGRFVQPSFVTGAISQSGFSVSTPFIQSNDNDHHIVNTLDNPYPTGLVSATGNSLGILTNVGSTSSFYDPNIGRPYTDTASLSVQYQYKDYLFDVGGSYNATHGLLVYDPLNSNNTGFNINNPSTAEWLAANTPTFGSNGLPVTTLAGNVQVVNPFLAQTGQTSIAQYVTNGEATAKTLTAYQLLRPNAVAGNILENQGKGAMYYYALNTKVERRFHDGFSVIQAFTWSKAISELNFIGPQAFAQKIEKRLAAVNTTNGTGGDQRFHYTLTPVYQLPFGKGKRFVSSANRGLDELIGGWEIAGQYNFLSGTPLVLPTNTGFFEGGDPSLGKSKANTQWFDTSRFAMFPKSSTSIANYPSWTGVQNMPGAGAAASGSIANGVYQDFATWHTYNQTTFGNIRNPYITNFDLSAKKAFALGGGAKFQVKLDAFNALNHPRFGSIDVTPGDTYFGEVSGTTPNKWAQANAPRQIQLSGKITF